MKKKIGHRDLPLEVEHFGHDDEDDAEGTE